MDTSSAVKLCELSDKVNGNLRALRTMGNSEQIELVPSWEQFTSFLEKRCQKLENVEHYMAAYKQGSQVGENSRTINQGRKTFIATNNTNNSTNGCVFVTTQIMLYIHALLL